MMMISHNPLEKKCYGPTVGELHCLRTALRESIPCQAKSEQNVQQDLIPQVRHREAALCTHRAGRILQQDAPSCGLPVVRHQTAGLFSYLIECQKIL